MRMYHNKTEGAITPEGHWHPLLTQKRGGKLNVGRQRPYMRETVAMGMINVRKDVKVAEKTKAILWGGRVDIASEWTKTR